MYSALALAVAVAGGANDNQANLLKELNTYSFGVQNEQSQLTIDMSHDALSAYNDV